MYIEGANDIQGIGYFPAGFEGGTKVHCVFEFSMYASRITNAIQDMYLKSTTQLIRKNLMHTPVMNVINSKYIGKNSICTYSKQWAAVNTQSGDIKVPPHRCSCSEPFLLNCIVTNHGHSPYRDS